MSKQSERDPIAIVGIGCRFPGGVNGPDSFWQLLMNGTDAVTDVPADRWDHDEYYDPDRNRPGKVYTRRGGFIEQVDRFDAEFFGISPREAARIDPQHRLLLEVAWEALEDAGQAADRLSGSRTGVFIGICTDEYGELQFREVACINPYTNIGGSPSIAANRMSHAFDFHGPSVAVDTACSSALVAVHLACQSIWTGESTMALAGGVHVMLSVERSIGFGKASMLSPTGRCWSFDARADGYVRGEGAGIVVLKPLSQAIADADPIYSVIAASGVNSDGRTTGLSLPSIDAQMSLLRDVYSRAGLSPAAVQYVEAHGTGTPAGDPVECTALGTVLGSGRRAGDLLRIGSVKTNIGHLEAASGAAGLIKAALSLKHRIIPATLNIETPNPKIDFHALSLEIQRTATPWPRPEERLAAGVASFGFGGTNAHVVLLSAPATEARPSPDSTRAMLLPISARTPDALHAAATVYRTQLLVDSGTPLSALCHTAAARRSHHEHRAALVGATTADLIEGLDALLAGEPRRGVLSGRAAAGERPRVAFVFAGNGPQWWGMGRRLLLEEPVFRETVDRCDELLATYANWSLLNELLADQTATRMHLTSIAQPALFAIQAGLIALLRSWGIVPDAVFGHSVGEVAAAFAAGVLDLEDAIKVIFHRSRTQELTAGAGKMAAVELSEDAARAAIEPFGGRVVIAAVNAPSAVTLSGDADAIDALVQTFEERQVFCRALRLNYAFHSHHMDPVRNDLLDSLLDIRPKTAERPFVSGVTGATLAGPECDAQYWWDNIRKPVLFNAAASSVLAEDVGLFLEIGPHPVLSTYVPECASREGRSVVMLPSLRREHDDRTMLLSSAGALHVAGYPLDWTAICPPAGALVRLPSYPWQRERHWYDASAVRSAVKRRAHPLLGARQETPSPQWRSKLDTRVLPFLDGHQIQGSVVFPAAGFIEMGLAAAEQLFGQVPCTLEDLEIRQALMLNNGPAAVHVDVSPDFTLTVSSREEGAEQEWRAHISAHLARSVRPDESHVLPAAEIRERCRERLSKTAVYAETDRMNHKYRGAFQGVEQVWLGDGESFGEIRAPDHVAASLAEYRMHPAILDACIQVILPILPTWGTGDTSPWLPVSLGRLTWRARPTTQVHAWARRTRYGADWLSVDCLVADVNGNVVVEMRDFKIRQLQSRQAVAARDGGGREYSSIWEFRPLSAPGALIRDARHLPQPHAIAAEARAHADARLTGLDTPSNPAVDREIDRLCVGYICSAFEELGLVLRPGERVTLESLRQSMGVPAGYRGQLRVLANILANSGVFARHSDDEWSAVALPENRDAESSWRRLAWSHPEWHAELLLLGRSGPRLAEFLSGVSHPFDLIFSDKSGTSEHFYDASASRRSGNLLLEGAMSAIAKGVPRGRGLRVLELAGGTGGATAHVLPVLADISAEYVFTDRANAALGRAEQRFRRYPFAEYRLLDIDDDPEAQGFEPHSFDVVLAGDLLSTLRNPAAAFAHIERLLASEGTLLLLEPAGAAAWEHLVFGFAAGAELEAEDETLARDPRREELLNGFSRTSVDAAADNGAGVRLTIARGRHIENVLPAYQPPTDASARWIVFADDVGIGPAVAGQLRSAGHDVMLAFRGARYERASMDRVALDPASWDDMNTLIADIRSDGCAIAGIVHCWSLDAPDPDAGRPEDAFAVAQDLAPVSVMHLFQAMRAGYFRATPPMWLVTSNVYAHLDARGAAVSQAPLWGFGRVLANEHPDLRCALVDLTDPAAEVGALTRELFAADSEQEVRLSGDTRWVHRIVPTASRKRRRRSELCDGESVRLGMDGIGVLDNLGFSAFRRIQPGPHEVEIEVYATGLNFKDVLQATGVIAGEALGRGFAGGFSLGLECSGVITAVGSNVRDLHVGQSVIAFGRHCFSGHIVVEASLVVGKPSRVSFEEAATLPVTFATASYALRHVGRVQRGDRVLIHGGAGGVGLAAIQIVRAAGGEIFASAGTPEKREFLRALGVEHVLDSRSLAFADDIMEITGGEGVDIVLNSLAGEASAKSVSVLKPFGRFLEIGKRDLLENRRQGLRPFERCLSFHAIDLDQLLLREPEMVRTLLQEIVQSIDADMLHPLPFRTFSAGESANAFRCMQQSRHIGKIVVSMRDPDVQLPIAELPRLDLRADATYVVAGGVGGFGLATARWLVDRGARHVVLFSRSATVKPEDAPIVQAMRDAGAQVLVTAADLTRRADVSALFTRVRESMPPVRGILHAAMILDDGVVLHLDRERFSRVTGPKIDGAWHLHLESLASPIGFFVLFSSFSSLVGSPGQGNYAAANAFLDTLAAYRRARGLPALTVNWGALADAGYLARHSEVADILQREGVTGLPVVRALETLERLMTTDAVQQGVMDVDWHKWARRAGRIPSTLSKMIVASKAEQTHEIVTDFAGSLRGLPLTERKQRIEVRLREHVAGVLGTAASKLDLDKPITLLGLDSLMAVELEIRIERDLGTNLTLMTLLQRHSVSTLSLLLAERMSGKEEPAAASGAAAG